MEYEMTNDITLPGRKPYKLAGQLNRNPRDFRLGAQIGKNYAVAFTSQYKPKSLISISSDLIRLIFDDKVASCLPILAITSLEYFCLFCWMKTLDRERSLSFHEKEAPPEMDVSFLDLSLRKTEVAKVKNRRPPYRQKLSEFQPWNMK
jgi:hypothetical protein